MGFGINHRDARADRAEHGILGGAEQSLRMRAHSGPAHLGLRLALGGLEGSERLAQDGGVGSQRLAQDLDAARCPGVNGSAAAGSGERA